jgi:hypothetical protein
MKTSELPGSMERVKWVCPQCAAHLVTHIPIKGLPECRSRQHRGKCVFMTRSTS